MYMISCAFFLPSVNVCRTGWLDACELPHSIKNTFRRFQITVCLTPTLFAYVSINFRQLLLLNLHPLLFIATASSKHMRLMPPVLAEWPFHWNSDALEGAVRRSNSWYYRISPFLKVSLYLTTKRTFSPCLFYFALWPCNRYSPRQTSRTMSQFQ